MSDKMTKKKKKKINSC